MDTKGSCCVFRCGHRCSLRSFGHLLLLVKTDANWLVYLSELFFFCNIKILFTKDKVDFSDFFFILISISFVHVSMSFYYPDEVPYIEMHLHGNSTLCVECMHFVRVTSLAVILCIAV